MPEPTVPSPATEAEEEIESHIPAGADADPTPEEEALADAHEMDPAVAQAEKSFDELGAKTEGEGQVA